MSYVGETFDLKKFYFHLYGYVAPPFPLLGDFKSQLLPANPLDRLKSVFGKEKKTLLGTDVLMPLSLTIPNTTSWEIPTEPIISIKGGHKIIRRYPNRSEKGGSIKERWSSDDFKISIKGVLVNFEEEEYPEDQVKQLRAICEHKGNVEVDHALLDLFGIRHIVITDYDIPHSQGLRFQAYSITAYSDTLFDTLLIES